MKIQDLAKEIALREGKKSQAHIGDIREILSIMSDMFYSEHEASVFLPPMFYLNGEKRAKRKKK
jgi:hypothetical protein